MSTDDDDWENEMLGDKPQESSKMSVEQARKILNINPAMRKQGVDTNFIIQQSDKAKGASATQPEQPLTKAPPGNRDGTILQAKDVDHLLDLTTQSYQQEKREIESEISILQNKLSGLKGRYLKAVMSRLALLDRNLSSPVTQAALQTHKSIMSEIGFTAQKFIEHLKQQR
jgi:hypothetical protein